MTAPLEVSRQDVGAARPLLRLAIMGGPQLTRYGMRLALETQPDFLVTADYADVRIPADPLQCLADVVLLDPVDCSGEAAAMVTRLRRSGCPASIVILADDSCGCVEEVLSAGASGVVMKDDGPEQLAHALRSVSAGYAVLPAGATGALGGPGGCCRPQEQQPGLARGADRARIGLLTEREREVLRGLMTGASNAEIALTLHLGVGTVKSHVQHLLSKLEVRNRQQAVIYAYEVGFGGQDRGSAPPTRATGPVSIPAPRHLPATGPARRPRPVPGP